MSAPGHAHKKTVLHNTGTEPTRFPYKARAYANMCAVALTGNTVQEILWSDAVEYIESSNVELIFCAQSETPSVILEIDPALRPYFNVSVRNKTLRLLLKDHLSYTPSDIWGGSRLFRHLLENHLSHAPSENPAIAVVVEMPSLKGITLTGGDFAEVVGLNAQKFEAEISGFGYLTLSGKAHTFSARITGTGDIYAETLTTQNASAEISGAGNIEICATQRILAKITGAGDITVYGEPQEKNTSLQGTGNILWK